MNYTTDSSRPAAYLVLVIGALLSVALATTPARGSVSQAKSAASPTKGEASRAKVAPSKTINAANKRQRVADLNHDLLIRLEENQKGLQRQFQAFTGTTQRRTNELDRQIDSLTDQLRRLASSQEQISNSQQLLTATIRSMQIVLIIIVGLLLVLCAALFFFLFRLKQFGGSQPGNHKQADGVTREAPDTALEAQWKVGL